VLGQKQMKVMVWLACCSASEEFGCIRLAGLRTYRIHRSFFLVREIQVVGLVQPQAHKDSLKVRVAAAGAVTADPVLVLVPVPAHSLEVGGYSSQPYQTRLVPLDSSETGRYCSLFRTETPTSGAKTKAETDVAGADDPADAT